MEITEKILIKKVNALYNKFGIRSVSMDDVAHELGISKKTVYTLVKDKEDLVEKVMGFEMEMRKNFLLDNPGRNAIEDLFCLNSMIIRAVRDTNPSKLFDLEKYHPAIFKKVSRVKRENTIKSMEDNFRKGKKEGLYRQDLNKEILSKMYVLRMGKMDPEDELSIAEFSSADFINEVFIYHIRGIASRKGIDFLEKNMDKILNADESNAYGCSKFQVNEKH